MDKRVGILGGGQLGRMLVEAANRLNIQTIVLDKGNSSAKQINSQGPHIDGDFRAKNDVLNLANCCDILTVEIEHVNAEILAEIEEEGRIQVFPSAETIKLIQDKYFQKQHWVKHQIPTPRSAIFSEENVKDFTYPFLLKSRTMAYDGRGNYLVKSIKDLPLALQSLAGLPLYIEELVDFRVELAVVVVKTIDDNIYSFPCVETVQKDNICDMVYAPARIDFSIQRYAVSVAIKAVKTLRGAGVFGVELFLSKKGKILINEVAPRPHNSGHYTIEACRISQFEAHLRAICGLAIDMEFLQFQSPMTTAIMINMIGTEDPEYYMKFARKALDIPGASVHLYGKGTSKIGRKMGHVTIISDSIQQCLSEASKLRPDGSDKDGKLAPQVGIIMGSDSDLPIMKDAASILESFAIPFELTIVSAHRTPKRMYEYACSAYTRGIRVIIAGAGGAAHLPGMVAAITDLPVIGVPVAAKNLDGLDSLYSIVQMPKGIPVATVAINNSTNAGLMAVRIIASTNRNYHELLNKYSKNMESQVLEKAQKLEALGSNDYLKNFLNR